MAKVSDLKSLQLKLASPEDILSWSHGEVTKPETINYRTQKPEKDGLFCERIFGPEKDYECYCGKYRRVRYKGVICDKCGVEVTRSSVRRERMGHIKLAVPVAHIWFLRGVPSRLGLLLDIPVQQLEKVIYYANYVVLKVNEEERLDAIKRIEVEYKKKVNTEKTQAGRDELKELRDIELVRLKHLKYLAVFNELDYHEMSLKYGEIFEASTGSEPIKQVLEGLDFGKLIKDLKKEIDESKKSLAQQKAQRRLILAERMNKAGIRPEWMLLTYLPIIPPELRPMVQLDGGRYASSDLNDLYRRVINRNNRLKRLVELNAPDVITRNEKRMLQEAVDALIDNSARRGQTVITATTGGKRTLKSLADMLKGKQGRFRQNLLGKRVDYSGRSVIVVGPELSLHQCGLPKKMALELFRPFVIHKIIAAELAFNVRAANRLIDETPPEVWAILEEVIEGKYVFLNRAPTLHRLGVQAFQPILIEGHAIQLHPLVCTAFNADFDGDQMAVHLPLSKEAQEEARTLMLASVNITKPATGTPIVNPTKDIVLGCYWMSKIKDGEMGEGKTFASLGDVRLAYDTGRVGMKARIRVKVGRDTKLKEAAGEERYLETCAGRVIFNQVLPDDFPFTNYDLDARALKNITSELFQTWGIEETVTVLDSIKTLGFHYSTISGTTWAMGDLQVPTEKPGIIKNAQNEVDEIQSQFNDGLLSSKERRAKVIEVWARTKKKIEELVPNYLDPHGSVALIVSSGARGSWSQPVQMMGMKGAVVNPAGQVMEIPIESSFKEGFTALEYFTSTHGARKGAADTALRTATAGYLTRRLVDVAQDLIIKNQKCVDKRGIILERKELKDIGGQSYEEKVTSRTLLKDVVGGDKKVIAKAGDIIDYFAAKIIDKDETIESIHVRSPLTCQDNSICAACYGLDLGRNIPVKTGEAVGIIAAQAIGEPGTQLTMRTFHTGGVAGASDVTQGLPRVEEIFEARTPKGKAVISEVDGNVTEVSESENGKVIKIEFKKPLTDKSTKEKLEVKEYAIPPNIAVWVERGDLVAAGSQLTEGHIDLKELYKQIGREKAQRHIVHEVQRIYTSHGATIHDKHIEIIVRQMFSRIKISDTGDSGFSPGEIVSSSSFLKENTRLLHTKKKEAQGESLILGITKVSLTTDSFLSAASFQETARVLIRAAVEGRKDELSGLKENVIIGKIIPAGTGLRKS